MRWGEPRKDSWFGKRSWYEVSDGTAAMRKIKKKNRNIKLDIFGGFSCIYYMLMIKE